MAVQENHQSENAMSESAVSNNTIRVAAFNIGLDQSREVGVLREKLLKGDYIAAQKSAEIIQRVRPDILLINEIDGNDKKATLKVYQEKYLETPMNKQKAISYPHVFMSGCNTGVDSGVKFRGQSEGTDRFGFGYYDGQYCMAVLSKYPIFTEQAHTFQKLLWKDMPDPWLPALNDESWYSDKGLEHFRLSSKTHGDIPININGKILHVLMSHPTPPVFDGEEDRNGQRNYDEVKFWQYYINGNTSWLKNDLGNKVSGLTANQRFVIMGDLNANMAEGSTSARNGMRSIESLIHDPRVASGFSEKKDSRHIPQSFGGTENDTEGQYGKYHTAAWRMRADYVLPSTFGLETVGSGVFWPKKDEALAPLVTQTDESPSSSDHRLVWVDLKIID